MGLPGKKSTFPGKESTPSNAVETDLIPDLEKSPQNRKPVCHKLLSLCLSMELQLLKPVYPGVRALTM